MGVSTTGDIYGVMYLKNARGGKQKRDDLRGNYMFENGRISSSIDISEIKTSTDV